MSRLDFNIDPLAAEQFIDRAAKEAIDQTIFAGKGLVSQGLFISGQDTRCAFNAWAQYVAVELAGSECDASVTAKTFELARLAGRHHIDVACILGEPDQC